MKRRADRRLTTFVLAAALSGGLVSSVCAEDCQDGTTRVMRRTFFSSAYAGRLAIAINAASPDKARSAESYCVLSDSFGSVARVRPRYDHIYFVFNNLPVVSPENAETSFLGLQVRAPSDNGVSSITMRREGDSWLPRPLDQKYPTRQFVRNGDDTNLVAQAHKSTQLASTSLGPGMLGGNSDAAEQEFASKVNASVHGAVKPREGADIKRTWDYRARMTFAGEQLDTGRAPSNVTAVWVSFVQRPPGEGIWAPEKRVITGVRIGSARQIEVEMFGSNPEIPSYRHLVQFAN